MSIRSKLFYAFIGVVAVPLAIAVWLADCYLGYARSDLDQRFVDGARETMRAMDRQTNERVEALRHDVHALAVDRDLDSSVDVKVIIPSSDDSGEKLEMRVRRPRPAFRVSSGMPHSLLELRRQHPEIVGVQLYADEGVIYSDLKNAAELRVLLAAPAARPDPQNARLIELGDGRQFVVDHLADDAETELVVEYDPQAMITPARVGKSGWAFYVRPDTRRPWHLPFVFWHQGAAADGLVRALTVPLSAFGDALPSGGDLASARDANWRRWRVYTALASETDLHHLTAGARLVAMASEDEIYAPLIWFRLEVYGALLASLLVAVWLAYFLSGRLVGAVDRIRSGVEALSRGEWAQLDKLSEDELGGGLVESVNHMATALAERTRRDEIEGWRRLVRVLSHEINNTLGPVRSVAVTVRDQIAGRVGSSDAAEDLRVAFQLILDRTDALTSFIAGYAELAKLPDPARADTDFNAVVDGAARLFREDAERAGIGLAVELVADAGRARIDAGQIERVVINLVKNAVEAVGAGGAVTVATARHGGSVELTVEDNGPGIALDARRHLFVPYFTTKPGGSGIGLALVRQIVLGHGGTVTAEDRPGGGTRLRVLLPVALHGGAA